MNKKTYIINEWNQLSSVPVNSEGFKLTVEHFRITNNIGTTLNIERIREDT